MKLESYRICETDCTCSEYETTNACGSSRRLGSVSRSVVGSTSKLGHAQWWLWHVWLVVGQEAIKPYSCLNLDTSSYSSMKKTICSNFVCENKYFLIVTKQNTDIWCDNSHWTRMGRQFRNCWWTENWASLLCESRKFPIITIHTASSTISRNWSWIDWKRSELIIYRQFHFFLFCGLFDKRWWGDGVTTLIKIWNEMKIR